MANFVCDICGGAIKMQANKTGVCQGCGMEYDIEAIRAMAGQTNNTATVTSAQTVSPVQVNDNEIDRDTLLIYLKDVQVIETIINTSKEELKKDKEYLLSHGLNYPKEPSKLYPPVAPENSGKLYVYIFTIFFLLGFSGFLIYFRLSAALTSSLIAMAFFLVIFCIKKLIDVLKEKKYYKISEQEYNTNLEIYHEEMKIYEDAKRRELLRYNNLKEAYKNRENEIMQDMKASAEVLKKAYSVNIIPMQFRTIEGVYYLYDYLSTSNQTLSEALMQANLEAIKQKLDDMIKLQSAQIIQQAQTNAKLDDIQETNNRILATAQQNAKNSSLAAKYAAITAVNSEVIKQLSKKQLAYQRADFWLR